MQYNFLQKEAKPAKEAFPGVVRVALKVVPTTTQFMTKEKPAPILVAKPVQQSVMHEDVHEEEPAREPVRRLKGAKPRKLL